MTPLGGLAFLLVGVVIFACGIAYLVLHERRSARPKTTVSHFARSRRAMRKLYRAQLAAREDRRARARAEHPARRRHRKSA